VDYVECIVIGAGVIGLGIARALAIAGHDVLLLERHAAIGTETSSRNSEVVHAGLHYPDGSLKARETGSRTSSGSVAPTRGPSSRSWNVSPHSCLHRRASSIRTR
jgi:glycine/D-amino acid oxidase-like deaminating enzyme